MSNLCNENTIQQMALQALRKQEELLKPEATLQRENLQSITVMITVNLLSLLTFDLVIIFFRWKRRFKNSQESVSPQFDWKWSRCFKHQILTLSHTVLAVQDVLFVFGWVCVCPECVRPPRASFIQQPGGKNNLLPVLMVGPAAPVWIGFRGHQSQAIRSKWSSCNSRQTAKSSGTKPRPPPCACLCVCDSPTLNQHQPQ